MKTTEKKSERATELEYLKWFRLHADFGPGDYEVKLQLDRDFVRRTGKLLPKGWEQEE